MTVTVWSLPSQLRANAAAVWPGDAGAEHDDAAHREHPVVRCA
ncbi:MAG: hypothetical protein ACLP0J_01815 [Solirubrobacteraceae bacterium]